MADYQSALVLLLFIVPLVFLIDTTLVVWRRNPGHKENRLATVTMALMTLIIFFYLVLQMLPEAYTLPIIVYVIYPLSGLAAGTNLLLHVSITRADQRVPFRIWMAASLVPVAIYTVLLLLNDIGFFFSGVAVRAMLKEGVVSIGALIQLGLFGLFVLLYTAISYTAFREADNRAQRVRSLALLKSNLLYQAVTMICIALYIGLDEEVQIPAAIHYITVVIWAAALRFFMKRNILPTAEKKYELLYQLSPSAIIVMDRQMRMKEVNPGALRLFGYDKEEELRGKQLTEFLPSEARETALSSFQTAFPDGEWSFQELAIVDSRQQPRMVEIDTELIVSGGDWQVLAVMKDITEQKEEEYRIHYMAYHDSLTKLPNRYSFNAELETSLRSIKSGNGLLGVLLIDLDRFKLINDTLGHSYGDEALVETAARLKEVIGVNDLLARLGGDEFIVLLRNAREYEDIIGLAESIIQMFQRPIVLLGQDFYLRGSIGISVYPYDGDTSDGLFKKADIAMYNAKQSGGNQYRMYAEEMIALVQRDVRMEKHLRKAFERKEWVLHYQPQIDLSSRRVIGAEALIRWRSEELGMVYPGEFITLAEQIGLINEIGQWVISEACRKGKEWQDNGWEDFVLSVNVSSRQLEEPNFVRNVHAALQQSGLHPSHLCLEITESMVVNKLKAARYMLDDLVALGIHIAIDDFGTGYSSLSVLRQLPISIIKIDRSFITDMNADREGLSIVRTIVSMGRDLSKQIVAEGVESPDQAEQLRVLGCDKAQGYHFHKPLPAEVLEQLLMQSGELRLAEGNGA